MSTREDQKWLEELSEQSRRKQEAFMDGIASKLRRPRVRDKPEHPFRGAPGFWNDFEWSQEERIAHFMSNFEAAGGYAVHVPSLQEARAFIVERVRELKAVRILRQQQLMLGRLDLESMLPEADILTWNARSEEDWRTVAAEADFGIVEADYAAAYTGSMVVTSSKNKGRSVSLLPAVLVAIIPVQRLKTRLGEIMRELESGGRESLPAGVHFISGPSRSADIENDLTIGVHGPGIVYAILVDDEDSGI